MNIKFNIRVGIKNIEKPMLYLKNSKGAKYPVYETFNPKFFIAKKENEYYLLTRDKQQEFAVIDKTTPSWEYRVKQYLKRQRDDTARDLLKEKE